MCLQRWCSSVSLFHSQGSITGPVCTLHKKTLSLDNAWYYPCQCDNAVGTHWDGSCSLQRCCLSSTCRRTSWCSSGSCCRRSEHRQSSYRSLAEKTASWTHWRTSWRIKIKVLGQEPAWNVVKRLVRHFREILSFAFLSKMLCMFYIFPCSNTPDSN